MRSSIFKIVTSTRFAQRNGRGREGERADRKPVERANRVLVTSEKRVSADCLAPHKACLQVLFGKLRQEFHAGSVRNSELHDPTARVPGYSLPPALV